MPPISKPRLTKSPPIMAGWYDKLERILREGAMPNIHTTTTEYCNIKIRLLTKRHLSHND